MTGVRNPRQCCDSSEGMNCKNHEFWLVSREVNKALQMCSSTSMSEYQKPDRKEFDDMKERSQFRPVNFTLKNAKPNDRSISS